MSRSEKDTKSAIDFIDKAFSEEEGTTVFESELSPFKLLFSNKHGFNFKGLKRFFLITFGFAVLNGNLAIGALGKYFFFENTDNRWLLVSVILAIGFTVFAGYKAYYYGIADACQVFYDKILAPQMKKATKEIIDKAAIKLQHQDDNLPVVGDEMEDFSVFIEKTFPKFVAKVFIFLFRQIPLTEFFIDAYKHIRIDKDEAAERAFTLMDEAFRESLGEHLSLKWLLWLIPVNIIVVLFCIGMI